MLPFVLHAFLERTPQSWMVPQTHYGLEVTHDKLRERIMID